MPQGRNPPAPRTRAEYKAAQANTPAPNASKSLTTAAQLLCWILFI